MPWRQIYEFLWRGVANFVQHIKMWTTFRTIKKKQTPRCYSLLWTQLPTVQRSCISILQTYALVLLLRRYSELCLKIFFVVGTGNNHRVIGLGPVASALGSVERAASPAFHAFNGADITGRLSGKGKLSCWKTFMDAEEDTITTLRNVGNTVHPPDEILVLVERLICQLYQPGTGISKVKDLRWHICSEKIRRNRIAFHRHKGHFMKQFSAHYQMIVWDNDKVRCPSLPQPGEFRWEKTVDEWIPVMTKEAPAPEAIVQLVKCGCQKNRFSNSPCHCRKSGLNCTYFCCCCNSDYPREKCMWRYWYTKNWVRGPWQWGVERLESRNVKRY